jgi:hypothetical protein
MNWIGTAAATNVVRPVAAWLVALDDSDGNGTCHEVVTDTLHRATCVDTD